MTPRDTSLPATVESGRVASAGRDRAALDVSFTQAYDELRRLARIIRRDDASATIDPTALVHAAWLKLAAAPAGAAAAATPLEFRRVVGRAMRQVLVDAARERHAKKRGGRDVIVVTLSGEAEKVPALTTDVLALHDALTDLERMSPRQAAVVESRYFAGLDVAETAQLLGVSGTTVHRDWRVASAWLKAVLRPE